jgi:hypothetical protein
MKIHKTNISYDLTRVPTGERERREGWRERDKI